MTFFSLSSGEMVKNLFCTEKLIKQIKLIKTDNNFCWTYN